MPAQPDFSYTYTFVAGAGVNSLYTGTVSCQLVTRPQIDSVTPDTDLVFVTIGGNDIGFSTIVVNCLTLRDPSSCRQSLEAASAKAPQMVERTKDALRAVEAEVGRPRAGLPAQLSVPRQHRELRHPGGRAHLRRGQGLERPPAPR